ncbi:GNAT family N-acetyltransferase [Acaryochloris sp. IP29b_bin.137]|uniref:GNAT family N-acetyltransferase n=1 Tax=Acaryochloris sp. IP29b_bin.137 TaxID=2969217 RepID=UPI00261D0968|nr:GNAT family N-acetyltransferase [Acaryochloris sp. IP29b_bin.137]
MPQVSDAIVRPMRDDERQNVHALMRRAFPLLDQWAFSWTPYVLVAEQGGQLQGAIVLKLFTLPRNRQAGSIAWVFTAPEVRGQGFGQRLIEAGINFFEQQGCDQILTTVEGFNTSSSKLFATRGFKILPPEDQFRRYGLATLVVWAKLSHYFDLGHFLWARPVAPAVDSPSLQWWSTITANSLIGLLMLWRASGFRAFHPEMWLVLPGIFLVLFGLRHLGMWLTAHRQGLTVRFRTWESGFLLSIAITLLFPGAIFPIPGSLYPITHQWRYRDLLPQLGWMAVAGTLPVLILVWGVWVLGELNEPLPYVRAWLEAVLLVGKPLVLFDIAMPFFPFVSFNGRRLWDWNKTVWGILAMATITIFLV